MEMLLTFQMIIEKGGKFVLSDDSHGVGQVGLNYHRMFQYIADLGLSRLHHLEVNEGTILIKEHPVAQQS